MRGSVTRAAEGFDRRAFTVEEVLRMQEAGIISEDENFELIEGEIVPMQAKTHAHRVREFWVVDAAQRRTWVHTGPKGDGWSSVIELGSEETLACAALPGFALRLGEV
jgi:Uma2 family endonuclease